MTPKEKPIFMPQPELEVPVVIYRLHRVTEHLDQIEKDNNLIVTYKDIMREIRLAHLAIDKASNMHDEKSVNELNDLLIKLETIAKQKKSSI